MSTTRRQSSRPNDPAPTDSPPMSPHLTSILIDTHSGVTTPEPLEANMEPTSNSGINPRPSNQSDLFVRHPRSRFTLYRILLGVIPFAFGLSKFIDSFNGAPLTLSTLDLIPAIFMFILYWCSLYEGDPPPHLQWLLDTDWNYIFDVCKRRAVMMKNNPLKTWSAFVLVCSVLLFCGTIVHRTWVCQGDCDVLEALVIGNLALGFLILNVASTNFGVSPLWRAHTYQKFRIVTIGLFSQIGSLVIWMLAFSSTINSTPRLFEFVAVCFSVMGSLQVFFMGRLLLVSLPTSVFWCILLCFLSASISAVVLSLSNILIHDSVHVWVNRVSIVINSVAALYLAGIVLI